MKFLEPWGCQRLSFLLEKAASREAKMWKVYMPKKTSSQDTDISPARRDEAVCWLTELHGRLQLHPETLVLAVSILDRFLASIKARPKYLRCIAITCFFLASKACEEDECVPSLKELAVSSSCGCSPSEILRMERIILDKLNWDLHTATALDFLHIFHAMVLSCRSGFLEGLMGLNRSQHLAQLTQQLYQCLCDHTLMQLRGSMLALALITLELETCCPDWLALTIELLRKAQIDSSELIRSRELVARSLSTPRTSMPPNTVYIYQPPPQPPAPDSTYRGCTSGTTTPPSTPSTASSGDQPLDAANARPQTPDGGEDDNQQLQSSASTYSNIPGLRPKHIRHPNHLQKVTLHYKASSKRKVEEMEVDDFYDGIKRLYNEDVTVTAVQEGVGPDTGATAPGGDVLGVCSVLSSRQEGSSSPCPPLQPASVS